jgi:flagellar hook-basal body complex protein FliE
MAVDVISDFTGRGEAARRLCQIEPRGQSDLVQPGAVPSFSELVKDFASGVNDLQLQAGSAIDQLATGRTTDVHQVMIAVEEASVALDLMLEIRNRLLEGYQELMRMQV